MYMVLMDKIGLGIALFSILLIVFLLYLQLKDD